MFVASFAAPNFERFDFVTLCAHPLIEVLVVDWVRVRCVENVCAEPTAALAVYNLIRGEFVHEVAIVELGGADKCDLPIVERLLPKV